MQKGATMEEAFSSWRRQLSGWQTKAVEAVSTGIMGVVVMGVPMRAVVVMMHE